MNISPNNRGLIGTLVALAAVLLTCYVNPTFSITPEASFMLSMQPNRLTADQHVGGVGEPQLIFEFTVPLGGSLQGGGWPTSLTSGSENDRSILQLELPVSNKNSPDETTVERTTGSGVFSFPRFCWISDQQCLNTGGEGLWKAQLIRAGGTTQPLQLATPRFDPENGKPLAKEIGVFLGLNNVLNPGDRVRFKFFGRVPARATNWAERPLIARLRYRSDPNACANVDGCWTTLSDNQVQPLHIDPLPTPSFIKVIAPLDVAVGEAFDARLVVTDRFSNPTPYTGFARLTAENSLLRQFNGEYTKTIRLQFQKAGFYILTPHLRQSGVRSQSQWVKVWETPPAHRRLLGDIHIHTGDGGAQRKFMGSFAPGDHQGLFTSIRDSLSYMETIAGYDFGAVSEHASRQDGYTLPPAVAADAEFLPGGACDGAGKTIVDLGNWWPLAQQAARSYEADSGLIVFPAFEWHARHNPAQHGDSSLLHRVVLYRDFDPGDQLPILPGDIEGLAPQCLIRFMRLAGYDPNQALVIPHMMRAKTGNIDWDLTYQDMSPGADIASRAEVESYQRIAEIFSARNNQGSLQGKEQLTAFEGDISPDDSWTFRYGWRHLGAHIGVIGGSDTHTQMPGSDDTLALDGKASHTHEPGGTAIVLSTTTDRDGIFDALHARASYATTGIRVWHNFTIDGALMGQQVASSAAAAEASIRIAAGQFITRVELWATRAGDSGAAYQDLLAAQPVKTFYDASVSIPNPVVPGAADEEWLYYVRAFFSSPHGSITDPEDALWSSPIWITWSNP